MAIHSSLTSLMEIKRLRAAFHLLPALNIIAIPFQEKYFVVALRIFVVWFFLLWKWVQRRSEGSPALECEGSLGSSCNPLDAAVSLAKSHFWIVASLGHRENLLSARSVWVQARDKGWV